MDRELQKYIAMAEEAGLIVERTSRGKHFKLYVVAPDGRKKMFTAPMSGSDWRGDKNKKAQLRAFAENRRDASE